MKFFPVKKKTLEEKKLDSPEMPEIKDADELLEAFEMEIYLKKQVNALYQLLINLYGSDKLVLRATKLNALGNIKSDSLPERVLALQKIVQEEPVLDHLPQIEEIPEILDSLHDQIAENLARRSVEDDIEKKINNRLQQKHEEYVKEIKLQILKENSNPENAQTLKKLAVLEKMEQKQMARTAMEFLRPAALEEIIGQQAAVKALLAKLASSFPQHILLYGPPGVGKTTAARLVLEAVKQLPSSPFQEDSPFIEVNGSTLRWDPREVTNPLLGSVHDPIYQGAKRDLADSGIPEPKLGLVSDAHGGVLFIDEIGEMDLLLQNKLLKVLEDKRVFFDSSYYDPYDPNIPAYVRKIFEEGAPADFILIGATTRSPQDLNPAIRSRCAEVYFEPLTPADLQKIVEQAAEKLEVELSGNVAETIAEYTIEGRKAVNILADAYGTALGRNGFASSNPRIELEDVYAVVQAGRLSPYVLQKASDKTRIGKIFGLGVSGFSGSVIEIEAVTFAAAQPNKGIIRFNDTAGSMAKDSVFNAASMFRVITGQDLNAYDLHINVVGGGNIDGPSAGLAIFLAIYSAFENFPLRQDMAVTGELSIRGEIRAVGGIPEKIYGAKQAGIKTVLLPEENRKDIPLGLKNIEIIPVKDLTEVLSLLKQ